jgi:hypothetical protein
LTFQLGLQLHQLAILVITPEVAEVAHTKVTLLLVVLAAEVMVATFHLAPRLEKMEQLTPEAVEVEVLLVLQMELVVLAAQAS